MGITPCILRLKSRDEVIKYDKRRYTRWNRIEITLGDEDMKLVRPLTRLKKKFTLVDVVLVKLDKFLIITT